MSLIHIIFRIMYFVVIQQNEKKWRKQNELICLSFCKTVSPRKPFEEQLYSSCLSYRAFSRLNCLVNQEKATQSNMRACMSERERGRGGKRWIE